MINYKFSPMQSSLFLSYMTDDYKCKYSTNSSTTIFV